MQALNYRTDYRICIRSARHPWRVVQAITQRKMLRFRRGSIACFWLVLPPAGNFLRSRSRGTSVTDAAYPLRVQSRAGSYVLEQVSFFVGQFIFKACPASGGVLSCVDKKVPKEATRGRR